MFKIGQSKIPNSGRKKGSITEERRNVMQRCLAEGVDPVVFLARQIKKTKLPIDLRISCAQSLLKFIAPAMSTVAVNQTIEAKVGTAAAIKHVISTASPAALDALEEISLKLCGAYPVPAEPTATPIQIAPPPTVPAEAPVPRFEGDAEDPTM